LEQLYYAVVVTSSHQKLAIGTEPDVQHRVENAFCVGVGDRAMKLQ
jgi:hypothetical protein